MNKSDYSKDFENVKIRDSRITDKSCIPAFTAEEKKLQKEKGLQLIEKITEAAKDLSKTSYTVEPGDYGFDYDKRYPFCNTDVAFCLNNIIRPDDNPFTVHAEGVTFWVEPTGRPFHYSSVAFLLYKCDNITFTGLTLDEYYPTAVEGKVTEIDKENNRIAISITNSSMPVKDDSDAKRVADGNQCRIVPFKASGEFISALYKIDPNGWGPGDMWLTDIKSTGRNNEFWLYFKTDLLIRTITSKEWEEVYSEKRNLKPGDIITIVFGNSNVNLDNCRKIRMIDFTNHISKSMLFENGGYGAHLWKDCHFEPRCGTSKYLNGCEGMFCGTRHGTTLDNTVLISSSDDHINIHGFWCKIEEINGKLLKIKNAAEGLMKGDKAVFYTPDGTYSGEAVIAENVENGSWGGTRDILFEKNIPSEFKGYWVRFPDFECDGWTIKNCRILNNYQRFLLQCGNGTFENNIIYNLGETFAVVNELGDVYIEGGKLENLTFRNNVIYDSANCPGARVFKFAQNYQWERKVMGGKMDISDNLFVECGMLAQAKNIESVSFKNNTVIEPLTYHNDITTVSQLYGDMINVDNFESCCNKLYSTKCTDSTDGKDKNYRLDKSFTEKLEKYLDNTDKSAKEIIETVKNNL